MIGGRHAYEHKHIFIFEGHPDRGAYIDILSHPIGESSFPVLSMAFSFIRRPDVGPLGLLGTL